MRAIYLLIVWNFEAVAVSSSRKVGVSSDIEETRERKPGNGMLVQREIWLSGCQSSGTSL